MLKFALEYCLAIDNLCCGHCSAWLVTSPLFIRKTHIFPGEPWESPGHPRTPQGSQGIRAPGKPSGQSLHPVRILGRPGAPWGALGLSGTLWDSQCALRGHRALHIIHFFLSILYMALNTWCRWQKSHIGLSRLIYSVATSYKITNTHEGCSK